MQAETESSDDVAEHVASFHRHLRSKRRSPDTILAYGKATTQLYRFLTDRGMLPNVRAIKREHLEEFIDHLMTTTTRRVWWSTEPVPAGSSENGVMSDSTIAHRYRSLAAFFRYLHQGNDAISANPMARMTAPTIRRTPARRTATGACLVSSLDIPALSGCP
jgi:site-specific recombinase XerD